MVFLISFATFNFYESQRVLASSALKFGVNKTINFNQLWLKRQNEFFKANEEILTNKKGCGYWAWKPYIIYNVLLRLGPKDFLIYSDSGIEIINDIKPLLDLCDKNMGITLFQTQGRYNKEWTKRDCFFYTNCNDSPYYEAEQAMGGFLILRKNEFTENFIREWMKFCLDKRIISDDPNQCGLPNLPEFIAHRHDQSVLSLLAKKNNVNLFRDPSQWGNNWKLKAFRKPGEFLDSSFFNGHYSPRPFENSLYPTILNNYRLNRAFSRNPLISRIQYYFDSFSTIIN